MNNLTASDLPSLAYLIGILVTSYLLLRSVVFPIIKRGASKTTTYIDDLFLDKKFLNRVSYVFVFVLFNFLVATPQFNLEIFNTEILNFSEFLIIIITDITNQKLIEEKQTIYLDDLTHELKTPLSTIIGYLETIDFNNYTTEENKNFLKIINSKTFEIKNLIDQILKLSETNIANKEILKINIQEILKSTIASYDNLFKKSGISFQIDIESANNKITSFTSMELEVVINNLLSNALKYTPKGKTVTLKTKITSENDLSIIIQDQGIGIPQKDLSRLTERFFRVDQSRNNQTGGHGLGLTIANHILSKNGCVLEISSELGKGSIFKFNLKLS